MKPSLNRDSYLLPLIVGMVSMVSLVIGMRLQESLVRDGYISTSTETGDQLSAIYEAAEHISAKFYGESIDSSFTDEAIEHMVDQLDPYSHYFKPEQDAKYEKYINGLYAGIGIEFIEYKDTIYCYDVVEGSPAHEAGIEVGDVIIQLDTLEFSKGLSNLDSLINYLRYHDRSMEVLVSTQDNGKERRVQLTPDDIRLKLVDDYVLNQDSMAVSYVKIHRFYKSVYQDLMQALEKHKDASGSAPRHMIIDVRDNPGGIVEETVKILNQFFHQKDQKLLETKSRNSLSQEYKSNGRKFLDIDRVVVLCNENSASASEILAGVLQDHNKAIIIGSPTYGKGLIQQNYDLSNRGSINLSIGEYILPSGRSIYKNSVDSTFLSVDGKRTLPGASKGIGVDISVQSCEPSSTDRIEVKKLIAAQKAWSLDERRSLFTSSDPIANLVRHDTLCQDQYIKRLKWQVLDKVIEAGATIQSTDVDLHIQTALQVLLEPDFERLFAEVL